MAITTDKILRMTFETAGGNASSITLPSPRDTLTAAEIESAMQLVITKNIFNSSGGDLVGIRDIKIIDTTTNDLFDPAEA